MNRIGLLLGESLDLTSSTFSIDFRMLCFAFRTDILNRVNRNKLQQQDEGLVTEIDRIDYFLNDQDESNLDLFCVMTK